MKQLYGTPFLTIYGEVPSALWVSKIAELTDEQCREGLARLADRPRDFPANLTDFVDACRPRRPVRYLGTPTTPARLRLDRPLASEETRQKYLQHMRSLFAK